MLGRVQLGIGVLWRGGFGFRDRQVRVQAAVAQVERAPDVDPLRRDAFFQDLAAALVRQLLEDARQAGNRRLIVGPVYAGRLVPRDIGQADAVGREEPRV